MSNVIKLSGRTAKATAKITTLGTSSINMDETEYQQRQMEESYKRGLKDGQEKTRRDLEQSYMDKLSRKYEEVFNILQQYDENLAEYEKEFEGLVIETAVELAQKIIQREIKDQTIINENVRSAISKIIGANEVKLKLHPSDLEELNESSKNILNSSSFSRIKIEADDRIQKGGCLVETEIGNVDARIPTQLEELRKQLEENLR